MAAAAVVSPSTNFFRFHFDPDPPFNCGCLSGQLRPRNPELGDYIAEEKRRKESQSEHEGGSERASERGGAGKRKGQRRGKESSAQDAFLTDRGMLRTCVSADRAGGGKNGAVTAGREGGL
ncbi:unnamed protein product [Sphagnum compactum]